VILVFSSLAALALFEVKVRLDMHRQYVGGNYPIVASDQSDDPTRTRAPGEGLFGPFPPEVAADEEPYVGFFRRNDSFYQWFLDGESRIRLEARYRTNNLGFVSTRDYYPRRDREREFRIALIGDSLTAAREMRIPWPDLLEMFLRDDPEVVARLGGRTPKVYNLGLPGAGFGHFERIALGPARVLDPDLVIVNYIENDFRRPIELVSSAESPIVTGSLTFSAVDGDADPDPDDVATLAVTCERPPVRFDNETCRHKFQLSMPYALAHSPEKVKRVKQAIVRHYLQGQLWRSPYPYGLMKLLGRPVSLHHYRHPELFFERGLSDDEAVETALRSLRAIRSAHPRVLVTLHPLLSEMFPKATEYELTNELVSRDPTFRVVVMRDRLGATGGMAEAYGWYNLPFDMHMSQAGGRVYARAMANVIGERLAEEGAGAPRSATRTAPAPGTL
jgi:hypothetical protein